MGIIEKSKAAVVKAPVSVIVPCYNCVNTIRRAFESIVNQTLKPEEIILVDDHSQDGTLDTLRSLANEYSGKVKVIKLASNIGAGSARNVGWNAATQTYIAFLDADDSWHPEKLRIQYEYMQNNPGVALCGHKCAWLLNDITPPVSLKELAVTRIIPHSLFFKNAFSTPTMMVKRNSPFRFVEGQRYAEDLFFSQRISLSGLLVVRIESNLAYIHKAPYGTAGLSAQLWKMERAELTNFLWHYDAGRIGFSVLAVAIIFSWAKYIRRILISWLHPMESAKDKSVKGKLLSICL